MLRDYLKLPRAVHILCLGMLLNRAGSFFVVFLTIYLREQLGFSIRFATLAIGVAGLGSMFGSIIGGQLADQVGRRPVMLLSLFGSALALVGLSFVHSPTLFLIGMFSFSCITDMYRPAASAMVGDIVETNQRQYSFGLMYVSINLGFAVAPPIGGFLTSYSWRWLFWGDALTTSLFGLLIVFLIRETRPKDAAERQNEMSVWRAMQHIAQDIPFVVFCTATFLTALVFMQSFSTLPLAMTELGITPSQFGFIVAINGVLIVIVQLPLTGWLSRFDRMSVIAAGGCFIAVGFGTHQFAVSGSSIISIFVMGIIVWTFGEMFQAPFKQAFVTDIAPVDLRARYLGMFSMMYSMAWAVGAPLGGLIFESFGASVLWNVCFCVAMVGVVLYVIVRASVPPEFGSSVS